MMVRGRSTRVLRRGVISLIAVLASICAAGPGSAAAAGAFTCLTPTAFIAQGSPTQLETVSIGPSGGTFTNVGGATVRYNALAFNETDGFLYAIDLNDRSLLRIDNAGTVTSLGATSGFLTLVGMNVGAMDDAGNYYVMAGSTSTLYKLNLTTRVATPIALTQSPSASDLTFIGGQLWGQSGQGFVRVNPATGVVTKFPASFIPATTTAGAAWTFGNGNLGISDNGSGTIYQVNIANANTATPTFTLVSTVAGPASGNNDGASCKGKPVDLQITKTGPVAVDAAGTITWTITVHNNGPGNSSGAVVDDDTPAAVTNVATTTPGCTLTTNHVRCVLGAIAAGADSTITITGKAPSGAVTSSVTNTASVLGNEEDTTSSNNTSSATTNVRPVTADLSLTKSANASVDAGGTITWTLNVHNGGPNTSTGSVVDDDIPASVTNVASSTTGCTVTGNHVHCAVGQLASGADYPITITGKAPTSATSSTVSNSATVTGNDLDPTATNNTGTSSTTVRAITADLSLTKSGPSSVDGGGSISWTLTVHNGGPNASTGYVVDDDVPASVTNVATTTAGCIVTGNHLHCSFASLASGADKTIALTGTAPKPGSATTLTNSATVTGNDTDPTPGNNSGSSTTTVNPVNADLSLTKSGPASADTNGAITWTLTVHNNGPRASTGSLVVDDVPASVANVASSTSGCTVTANHVQCTVGALAVGADKTITITGTAPASAAIVSNSATVAGSENDPTSSNNTGSSTTTVTPVTADLSLTKAAPSMVDAGGTITWTLTVHNAGPRASTGSVVDDDVPASVTNVAASTSGCTVTGNHVHCVVGALGSGADKVITITGKAPAAGGTVANTASVTGNEPDPDTSNNSGGSSTTVGPPPADLSIVKTADQTDVNPGDAVTYHLTVHNSGPGSAANVVVTDTIPAGVTLSSVPAGCTVSGTTLTCPLGTLAAGATQTINVHATADALSAGGTDHQHLLTITKVEAQVDFDPGQTRSVNLDCPTGTIMTDGGMRVDEVDQGTGTLADVHVLNSATDTVGRYAFTAQNTATGRAQAKVFGVCVASPTGVEQGHSHPLLVSGPVSTTSTIGIGRTTVNVTCGSGQIAIAPGFTINSGFARLVGSEPTATGQALTFETTTGAQVVASARCLDKKTGVAAGHVHTLKLTTVDRDVTVPANSVVTERVTCPDDAKGIVSSFLLDPGLISLGNDPQPKSRDFRLDNPTGSALHAHLDLVCLGDRTSNDKAPKHITNSAMVSSSTPDPDSGDLASSATVTVHPN